MLSQEIIKNNNKKSQNPTRNVFEIVVLLNKKYAKIILTNGKDVKYV